MIHSNMQNGDKSKSFLRLINVFHWSFYILLLLTIIFFANAMINTKTNMEAIYFWNSVLCGVLTFLLYKIRSLLLDMYHWMNNRKN